MGLNLYHYLTVMCLALCFTTVYGQDTQGSDCPGINSFFVGSVVPNPSFEKQGSCPVKASDLDKAESWEQATLATTDYFTEGCYMGEGFIIPPTPFPDGKSCVGIITEGLSKVVTEVGTEYFVYQEYLGTNLSSSLENGVDYTLKMHVGFGTPDDQGTDPDDIETYISTPDETTLVLYGFTDKGAAKFPFKTRKCIIEDYGDKWEEISRVTVKSNGLGWVETKIDFKALRDYNAIIIGGACNTTVDHSNPTSEYVFIDNLILNKAEDFEFGMPTKVGSICNGDLKLIAPEIAPNMVVSYEWYKDDQLIPGEFSSELFLGSAAGVGGLYHVVITDGKDCAESQPIEVDENSEYNMLPAGTLCKGGNLTLDAGVGYDTYAWSTGESTQTITITSTGTYSVTVTKGNGCTDADTVNIDKATDIAISGNVTDADYGEANGAISVNITGGTTPYEYKWSNGETDKDMYNLPGGTYTLEVWDRNGCYSTEEFTVNEVPKKLMVNISVTPVRCHGEKSGSIEIEVSGGVPPYEVAWPELEFSGNHIENLGAGQYHFIVKDSQGKKHEGSASVVEPELLYINNVSLKNPDCHGSENGEIEVNVYGGELPYAIKWEHTSASDLSFDNLPEGEYRVTITDKNGCEVATEIILNAPAELSATFVSEDPSCYGAKDGSIRFIDLTGGQKPYRYFINGVEEDISTFQRLGEGIYTVEIIDDNGCSIADNFVLIEPDHIEVSVTSNKSHIVEGDSVNLYLDVFPDYPSGFNYFWKSSLSNDNADLCDTCYSNTVFPRHKTTFSYVLTNGACTYSDEVTIYVDAIRVYMPNAFTPNEDGVNDKLTIGTNGENLTVVSFDVYNRWGTQVYSERNVSLKDFQGWDGRFKDQSVQAGTYFYKVDLMDKNGKHFKRQSSITILD